MSDGRPEEPYGGTYDAYGRPVPPDPSHPLPPHTPRPDAASPHAAGPGYGGPAPYAQDPYAGDAYGTGSYGTDPYGTDPYASGPYGPDAYAQDPYGRQTPYGAAYPAPYEQAHGQPYEQAHGQPYEQPHGPAYDVSSDVTYEVTRIDGPQPGGAAASARTGAPPTAPGHTGALPHGTPSAHQPLPASSGPLRPGGAGQPLPPESHTEHQPMPQHQPRTQPGPQPAPHAHATRTAPQPPPARQTPADPQTAAAPATAAGTRQRTGSPIIAPGLRPAAVTAVLAALLAATAPLGHGALAGALVLLQALTAAGWYRLNGMWPARQGIALAFVAGLTADAGLLLTDGGSAPTVLLGAAGVWCVLSLVLQLRNNSSPDERLYALTAGFAAIGLTVLAAGLLPAEADAVTVGAAAVAVAALARAVPLPGPVSVPLALVAAAAAGAAAGRLTGVDPVPAALIGLGAGVCAVLGLRVASYDWPSRFVHMTAGVALPLTLAVPAVQLLGRTLL
ncbi:hypothetical protein [Streptomyces sp. AA1529]|uniref:hypothetical protein n=1 Tax=Streptomyces sp. AA1529 TaxID=1203257 RepID=UPI0002DA5DBC|nr:hypothetical protein [Streptomyces sp. AA1529]